MKTFEHMGVFGFYEANGEHIHLVDDFGNLIKISPYGIEYACQNFLAPELY